MRFLTGFAAIAADYDGFVLDLWGVIHDGVKAFPHAIDCLPTCGTPASGRCCCPTCHARMRRCGR